MKYATTVFPRLVVGLGLVSLFTVVTGSAPAADRPNIVLVFIDDMGWGDFSCFGNEAARTIEGMGPKLLQLTMKPGQTEPDRIWAGAERLGGPHTWMLRSKITTGFVDAAIAFMKKAAREEKPFYINVRRHNRERARMNLEMAVELNRSIYKTRSKDKA